MLYGGLTLAGIGGVICFVCSIIVIVKLFQRGQTGLGVVSLLTFLCLGPLVPLIIGWVKATELNMKNMMLIFTVGFIAFVAGYGMAFAGGFSAFTNQLNTLPR
jgi:hypothetical protein